MQKVKVEVEFVFTENESHPPVKGVATIRAISPDPDILPFETRIEYDGNDETDIVGTITRMDRFKNAIPALSMAACPVAKPLTEEEIREKKINTERDAFYEKLEKDLLGKSYGEIREFVTTRGLDVAVRNGHKEASVAKVIAAVKELEKKKHE